MDAKLYLLYGVSIFVCQGSLFAEARPQVVLSSTSQTGQTAKVSQLSADELVFLSRLSDKARKLFTNRLSPEQRVQVMIAVDNGAEADVAVLRMAEAVELKGRSVCAQTEGSVDLLQD